jgi:hypothetical protein
MCYDEGTLQEYIDREITGRKRWEIEAHVASCEECKKRLKELEKTNNYLASGLSAMSKEISVGEKDLKQAWVRLAKDERFGAPVEKTEKKGAFEMTQNRLRKVLIPVAAVAAITISLSFAPVRSFAAEILNIFRVEKMEVVTVSPEDVQQMEKQMKKLDGKNGGMADIKNFGKVESTGFGRAAEDMTIAEAEKAAGFKLSLPAKIGDRAQEPTARVTKGSEVSLTLDVAKANKMIESFGGQLLLPGELDGKKFTIKIPTVVEADYSKSGDKVMIAQGKSPELILPDGVDPLAVRSALLSIPVIPDNIKQQIEAIQDWKHTLIIPNVNGSSQKVDVNGAEGVFIQPPNDVKGGAKAGNPSGDSALIWQKDGTIYAIGGNISLAEKQEIASSMK